MSANDLLLLLFLVAFGILVGCVGGVVAAKRGNDLSVTIVPTALWATALLLVVLFIWAAGYAISKLGFSLGRALLYGVGCVFLFGIWMPIVTAFPTVISTIIAYLLTRNCRQKRLAEQDVASDGDSAPV